MVRLKVIYLLGKVTIMVSQVGSMDSMPSYNNPLLATNTMATNNNNSIFNYANPLATGTTYDNDMFMPEFLKTPAITAQAQQTQQQTPQVQNPQGDLAQQQVPQAQYPQQEVPTSQAQSQAPQYDVAQQPATSQLQNPQFTGQSELNGCLADAKDEDIDYTKSGNPYKKASFGKKSGAVLGFLAPIASSLAKGSGNWKELLKTCPLFAIAGFGIGYLIDSCTESNRANAADAATNQAKQQMFTQGYQQSVSAVA